MKYNTFEITQDDDVDLFTNSFFGCDNVTTTNSNISDVRLYFKKYDYHIDIDGTWIADNVHVYQIKDIMNAYFYLCTISAAGNVVSIYARNCVQIIVENEAILHRRKLIIPNPCR